MGSEMCIRDRSYSSNMNFCLIILITNQIIVYLYLETDSWGVATPMKGEAKALSVSLYS